MLTCIAKFPAAPDPATTPATKQPVSQHFSASVDGTEVVPVTEYDMAATESAPFDVAEGSSVVLSLFYRDASGLDSPVQTQTISAPAAPDTVPPDAPGDFGEVKFEETPAVVEEKTEEAAVEEKTEETPAEETPKPDETTTDETPEATA